eukprot:snap_masked-scaffold_7-processed-gene-12.1-mRNA-1 protein AED:0.28 eAED:0.31 QI:0/0/0/1/1/1/2/0/405
MNLLLGMQQVNRINGEIIKNDTHEIPFFKSFGYTTAVLLSIVAAFFSNLGSNVQKISYHRKYMGRKRKKKLIWVTGLFFMALGAILDFVALGFAPQSVVAPLGSLTLVFNLYLAQFFHHEKVSSSDILATMIIITGCVVCVATSNHNDEISSVHDLLQAFRSERFAWYLLFVAILSCIFLFITLEFKRSENYRSIFDSNQFETIFRYSLPAFSGLIGAQSVLFAKTLDELIISSLSKEGSNTKMTLFNRHNYFYQHTGQLYLLNLSLKSWDALYVIPVFQSNWIIFSVIGGGVFYNEFEDFSAIQVLSFWLGICTTLIGVYLLSKRQDSRESMGFVQAEKPISSIERELEVEGLTQLDDCLVPLSPLTSEISYGSYNSENFSERYKESVEIINTEELSLHLKPCS